MSEMQAWQPGDRIYRWVWVGGNDSDIQTLTVVRVNRKTITVRTDSGSQLRIDPAGICGRVDWDESA